MITFSQDDFYLVTGASSGLGRAISLKINENGGSVIGIGRNKERLNETKNLAKNTDNFRIEIKELCDDMDNLPKWISGIVEKYGKIKGMVLSHGVQETLPLSAINIEKAKKLFDTNYFSLIGLIKGFCKKNNYTEIGNSIVCLSSFVTQIGLPATVNYSASKGALNSAVKVLGVELARNGIRINSILSGHIETELLSKEDNLKTDDFLEKLRQKYPLGLGKPEDIANLASFLLSDASRWITGANIVIDGGGSLVF